MWVGLGAKNTVSKPATFSPKKGLFAVFASFLGPILGPKKRPKIGPKKRLKTNLKVSENLISNLY
jgi:hypothetical protein